MCPIRTVSNGVRGYADLPSPPYRSTEPKNKQKAQSKRETVRRKGTKEGKQENKTVSARKTPYRRWSWRSIGRRFPPGGAEQGLPKQNKKQEHRQQALNQGQNEPDPRSLQQLEVTTCTGSTFYLGGT